VPILHRHGYRIALGDVYPFDVAFAASDQSRIVSHVESATRPGSIVILHSGDTQHKGRAWFGDTIAQAAQRVCAKTPLTTLSEVVNAVVNSATTSEVAAPPPASSRLPPTDGPRFASTMFRKSVKAFLESPPPLISGRPLDTNLTWSVEIMGPPHTPFEGGKFLLRVYFDSNDHPFRAPKVHFMTRMFHPNIDIDGRVDVDILGDNWCV
jgi:hypothetical protein